MFRGVYERIGIDPVVNEFPDCIHDSKYISVFKQLTGIDILPDNKHRWADTSYSCFMGDFYAIFKGDSIICRLRQINSFIPVCPMEQVSTMVRSPDNHLLSILCIKHSICRNVCSLSIVIIGGQRYLA